MQLIRRIHFFGSKNSFEHRRKGACILSKRAHHIARLREGTHGEQQNRILNGKGINTFICM